MPLDFRLFSQLPSPQRYARLPASSAADPVSRAPYVDLLRAPRRQLLRLTWFIRGGINGMVLALQATANSLRRHLRPLEKRPGVLFIGYAEGDLGLGQAFRAQVDAAARLAIPLAIYPFREGIETRMMMPFMAHRYDIAHAFDINVIALAPDQTPAVFRTVDPRLTLRSYNVLSTFWELPEAPSAWNNLLRPFDELWVPNTFVANAFRSVFPGTITIIPPAIATDQASPSLGRRSYGMDEGRFYFLFSFDYYSSPYRKNPVGVLQAFQQAFPNPEENVGLVLKSVGDADLFPEIHSLFLDAAQHDPRILLIHRSLERSEMLGLISNTNCYISLHRSEGFGMAMAEAMSTGCAVIGTDFSGNTCFLTNDTGFPVPYTLRPVNSWEYPAASGQAWAEPTLAAAVEIMRSVVANPTLAVERARAAKALVTSKYGPAAAGDAIKRRIFEINGCRRTARVNEL